MARKTRGVLHLPLPAALSDVAEALNDVEHRWAGATVTVEAVTWSGGEHMLVVHASRRRRTEPARLELE